MFIEVLLFIICSILSSSLGGVATFYWKRSKRLEEELISCKREKNAIMERYEQRKRERIDYIRRKAAHTIQRIEIFYEMKIGIDTEKWNRKLEENIANIPKLPEEYRK